jgi:predicted GNAT family N-acyltransferase
MNLKLEWRFKTFEELSKEELYALLRLRCEVFVVEQNCNFLDLDNKDQKCLHVCGYRDDTIMAVVPHCSGRSVLRISLDRTNSGFGERQREKGLALSC